MKIAIIGTGIAGLGAAYALSRVHEVELFEAGSTAGGHAHTVTHDSLQLDMGFIVHNTPNYPSLTRLFRELGVATQSSEMSFSVSCGCGLEWSSRRPWRAGPRLLREIARFLRTAGSADASGKTFDRFLRDEGYSESFRWHYLVPMTSALWSTAPGRCARLPRRLRDRVLPQPLDARPTAQTVAHGQRRQPGLRGRAARANRGAVSISVRPFAPFAAPSAESSAR